MKTARTSTWIITAIIACQWCTELGDALLKSEVDERIGGGLPGTPAAYVAIGHIYFDSVDSFQVAFAPHAGEIMADIPSYTDIEPSIQVSEVKA